MKILFYLIFLNVLCSVKSFAVSIATLNALRQFEYRLQEDTADGFIDPNNFLPIAIVKVSSINSQNDELKAALAASLQRVFRQQVHLCDACDQDLITQKDQLTYRVKSMTIPEINSYFHKINEKSRPKSGIWLTETELGLSFQIVSLDDARILAAHVVAEDLDWSARSLRNFSMSRNAERQARGDLILHNYVDIGIYPSPLISWDGLQQWGQYNQYLSGISLAIVSAEVPLGFGVAGYKVFNSSLSYKNIMIGAKLLFNVANILTNIDGESVSQAFTAVLLARVPIPENGASFFLNLYLSSAGTFGVGISL